MSPVNSSPSKIYDEYPSYELDHVKEHEFISEIARKALMEMEECLNKNIQILEFHEVSQ